MKLKGSDYPELENDIKSYIKEKRDAFIAEITSVELREQAVQIWTKIVENANISADKIEKYKCFEMSDGFMRGVRKRLEDLIRPVARDTAYWHKVLEILVCRCSPGLEDKWSACGSAVCEKHDIWRRSGCVVGGDSLGLVHKLSRDSLYCYVVTSQPSSLSKLEGIKRQHCPIAVFGEVPVLITSTESVQSFMSGIEDMLVFVDFSPKEPHTILRNRNDLLVRFYYFYRYRYLGVAKLEKSKSSTLPGTLTPNFHDVEGAICVFIDNQDPFSQKSVFLVTTSIVLSLLFMLWTFGYLQIQLTALRALLVFFITVSCGLVVLLYISIINDHRPRYYNPRPVFDPNTIDALKSLSSALDRGKWTKIALYFIDLYLNRNGGLKSKRSCVKRRVDYSYVDRIISLYSSQSN